MLVQLKKADFLNLKAGDEFQELEVTYDGIDMISPHKLYYKVLEVKPKNKNVHQLVVESRRGNSRNRWYKTRFTINDKMNSTGIKHEHISGSKVRRTFAIIK